MKKVLIVIDMQNDFIYGSLGNDDCRNAVAGCVDLCENGGFDKILFTQDTHDNTYLDTLEGKKLPVKHCIIGTPGRDIIPELVKYADTYAKSNVVTKWTFGVINTIYWSLLNEFGKNIDGNFELHFCGVCTSICVLSNMTILRAHFPNTRIVLHKNATGDVTEEMKQAAFVCAKAIQCEVED